MSLLEGKRKAAALKSPLFASNSRVKSDPPASGEDAIGEVKAKEEDHPKGTCPAFCMPQCIRVCVCVCVC